MIALLRRLSWILLLLSGAFSFAIESGLLVRPVAPDLGRLPARLGPLELGAELPVDPAALGDQPPERLLFRTVRDEQGHLGRLCIAYYERAQRWSGRPHDVEKCFAAEGWRERDARRLADARRPWSRLLEREGRTIRLVHWLEHPGDEGDALGAGSLATRLGSLRGFRPDVASVYLEFEAGVAPDDERMVAAVQALSAAIDGLW